MFDWFNFDENLHNTFCGDAIHDNGIMIKTLAFDSVSGIKDLLFRGSFDNNNCHG